MRAARAPAHGSRRDRAQRKTARALGVARCPVCGDPVKEAPGLTLRELRARRAGYCTLDHQEQDDD